MDGFSDAPSIVILCPADLLLIEAAARAALPRESCGFLIGRTAPNGEERKGGGISVERIVETPNGAQTNDRFEIDPQAHFALMREIGDGPERIIGHFHSHPNGRPDPSETDLSMAWDPEMVWLITAVKTGGHCTTAAFRPQPRQTGFTPLSLRLA